jgi:multiple sugar transport system ATP-binding protein
MLLHDHAPRLGSYKKTTSSEVILGIRPENVVITKEGKSNSLKATIVHIEPLGKESNVHLEAGGNPLVAIRSSTQDLRAGDKVWLSFGGEKIHVFDLKSGEALLR